jgi:hypothetical protein
VTSGLIAELPDQRRLTDPGLTYDDHELAARAFEHRLECLMQRA